MWVCASEYQCQKRVLDPQPNIQVLVVGLRISVRTVRTSYHGDYGKL